MEITPCHFIILNIRITSILLRINDIYAKLKKILILFELERTKRDYYFKQ